MHLKERPRRRYPAIPEAGPRPPRGAAPTDKKKGDRRDLVCVRAWAVSSISGAARRTPGGRIRRRRRSRSCSSWSIPDEPAVTQWVPHGGTAGKVRCQAERRTHLRRANMATTTATASVTPRPRTPADIVPDQGALRVHQHNEVPRLGRSPSAWVGRPPNASASRRLRKRSHRRRPAGHDDAGEEVHRRVQAPQGGQHGAR
jgi:hypothetical protein